MRGLIGTTLSVADESSPHLLESACPGRRGGLLSVLRAGPGHRGTGKVVALALAPAAATFTHTQLQPLLTSRGSRAGVDREPSGVPDHCGRARWRTPARSAACRLDGDDQPPTRRWPARPDVCQTRCLPHSATRAQHAPGERSGAPSRRTCSLPEAEHASCRSPRLTQQQFRLTEDPPIPHTALPCKRPIRSSSLCRVALSTLALALGLTACSSPGQSRGPTGPTDTTAVATVDPTVIPAATSGPTSTAPHSEVAGALLAPTDLPPGWSRLADAAGDGAPSPGCLADLASSKGGSSRAEATFRGGPEGADVIDETLESFPLLGARAELDRYRQVLAMCTEVTVASHGLLFSGAITPVPMARFGDDSSAYQMELNSTIGTVQLSLQYGLVVARRGPIVMVLVVSSLDPLRRDRLQQETAHAAMAKVE